jgi:hypothetical protein
MATSAPPVGALSLSTLRCKLSGQGRMNGEKMLVGTMTHTLEKELEGHTRSDVEGLVEHFFPDSRLPLPITQDLLRRNGSPTTIAVLLSSMPGSAQNTTKDTTAPTPTNWPQFQKDASGEDKLSLWFRFLGQELQKIVERDTPGASCRFWSSAYHNTPLRGSNHVRKPDLALTNKKKDFGWQDVATVLEMTSKQTASWNGLNSTINNKVCIIFYAQPDRRFVLVPSLLRNDFRLSLYDREGVLHSAPFTIGTNPLLFLRLMVGLFFVKSQHLGYDPNIIEFSDGTRRILFNNIQYEVKDAMFVSEGILGRGTVCWHVHKEKGDEYVIKSVWQDEKRKPHEAIFLEKLKECGVTEGVPELVDSGEVIVDGQVDSTSRQRPKACSSSNQNRVHRMVVQRPVGKRINHFASKREILSSFIQLIQGESYHIFQRSMSSLRYFLAHQSSSTRAKILHRDISVNNLILVDLKLTEPITTLRRGSLIDYDYAAFLTPRNVNTDKLKEPKEAVATLDRTVSDYLLRLYHILTF